MRSFTYTIHIERTPEQVWAFMLDFDKAPRWRNLVRKIEVATPPPIAVGTELRVTFDVRGEVRTVSSHVWACDYARRWGVRNTEQKITGTFLYQLEPDEGGTRVTFSCDIRPHGLMWLLLPLLIPGNRHRYQEQLPNLKAEVERDRIEPWTTSASARPA
jgi:hypothetical protein